MPDKNKMKALEDAGFKIQPTCRICSHFSDKGWFWGTCREITYIHTKHTGDPREASVPRIGHCPKFYLDEKRAASLNAHLSFLQK